MGVCSAKETYDENEDVPYTFPLNTNILDQYYDSSHGGNLSTKIPFSVNGVCTLHAEYTGRCLYDRIETTLRIEKEQLLIEKMYNETVTVPHANITQLDAIQAPEDTNYKWMVRIHWISWTGKRGVDDQQHTFVLLCNNAHDLCTHATMSKSCDDMGLNKPGYTSIWDRIGPKS